MDLADTLPACFSVDYVAARDRFMAQCERYGVRVQRYINPERGPRDEALTTDAAWFGPEDARRVMVLISATHGVEGFCGSACQVDWLRDGGPARLHGGTAALLLHAINPHGFAWLRRVTEEGVDLNRNGIDFARPLPENPGYAELKDAFLPPTLSGPAYDEARAKLQAYRDTHGDGAFRDARGGGQHIHPEGIFYGGTAPTWARRTVERIIVEHRLAARDVVAVIDVHTGLGPFGYGEPICGNRPGEPGQARCRAWYGDSLTEPLLGSSSSRVIKGLQQYVWARELGLERFSFIALEFGTYPQQVGEHALIADHWLHARGTPDWNAEETRRIKAALRRFYYPATADWQEMVLVRSRQIVRQTLLGLAGA